MKRSKSSKRREEEFERCANCVYLAKMVSHPCTDGKPLSNMLGWACVMLYMHPDGERGPIIPNWDYSSIGCEMFIERRKG